METLLSNREYSNFSIFGIGKPTERQRERQAKRAKKRDPMQELTGCQKPAKSRLIGAVLSGGGVQQVQIVQKYQQDLKNYKKCLQNYKDQLKNSNSSNSNSLSVAMSKLREAEEKQLEIEKAQEQEANRSSDSNNNSGSDSEVKKFLGMPQTTGIVVTSVVGFVLLVTGFIVYKKMTK